MKTDSMTIAVMAFSVVAAFASSPSLWAQDKSKIIKIDGSSTVYPLTEAVAEEFQKEKEGKVKVTVGISGTGGGFKKFVRGETDVQNASRPILKEELEQAKKTGSSTSNCRSCSTR